MTRFKKLVSFLPWLVVFEGVSLLIGYHASPNPGNPGIQNWYNGLAKSALNPPAFVFPLAWTILYALIAWSLWRVFTFHRPHNKSFWALATGHMLLNWGWSYVFFAGQDVVTAFVWLLAVLFSAVALYAWERRFDRFAAALLVPYLMWLLFASYLNGYIVWTN